MGFSKIMRFSEVQLSDYSMLRETFPATHTKARFRYRGNLNNNPLISWERTGNKYMEKQRTENS